MTSTLQPSSKISVLRRRAANIALALAVMLLSAVVATQPAQAQTFNLLYQFTSGKDGANPIAGLLEDTAGNFYGTTSGGGLVGGTCKPLQGCGVVFKLDPSGKQTVLYSFTGLADGEDPNGGLILDAAMGNLYGIAAGGASKAGVVFKLDTAGSNYAVLYSFTGGVDGYGPQGSLVLDKATGNLYGATQGGGASMHGTIFKLDTSGNETVLYTFTGGADGSRPLGSLVLDPAGTFLYGTTPGTVFKADATTGAQTVLYTFPGGTNGATLRAGVILDPLGNLYGTSSTGGALNCTNYRNVRYGCGFVFKLDPSLHETDHSFTMGEHSPVAGVVRDTAGNLYGTTQYRGPSFNAGVAFKLDPSRSGETVLFDFSAGGLNSPAAGLVLDPSGNLYGTTEFGGFYGAGTVFKINPTGSQNFPLILAPAGKGSGTVTGNPPGIDCPISCLAFFFPGKAVTLTATAAAGSVFSGWGFPSCPGTGPCTVTTTNSRQVVFATFLVDFGISATALTPGTVSPGGSSTSTLNMAAGAGFNGAVALTCSVQPTPALAPTCSISPSSAIPGTPATLTVSTTGPTAAALTPRPGAGLFYAAWLPLIGLVAARAGLGSGRKGRILAVLLACVLFAGVVFQAACGGSGSSGGGSSGTPPGTYTITVNGTDSTGTLKHSTTTMLKVQ